MAAQDFDRSPGPVTDRQAIADQIFNYARAMDRIDHALGYAVWHAEGTADYGALFSGSGRSFVDWVCATHATMIGHVHRVSNLLIKLDENRAASEAYVHATLRFEQDGVVRQASAWGRYLDRWSRREGLWAIDHRIYVQDLDEVRDAGPQLVGGWGRRDSTDPSYAVLDLETR